GDMARPAAASLHGEIVEQRRGVRIGHGQLQAITQRLLKFPCAAGDSGVIDVQERGIESLADRPFEAVEQGGDEMTLATELRPDQPDNHIRLLPGRVGQWSLAARTYFVEQ